MTTSHAPSPLNARAHIDPPAGRCPTTELQPDQCAHCRHRDRRPTRGVHGPNPAYLVDPGVVIRSSFEARYSGACDRCGERFARGAWMHRTSDGGLWCNQCC